VGERILATASELFYREGVRAVGIQRVIDEAGIAKASLYAHYASKDELVAACLSRQGDCWRTSVEEGLRDPSLDARAKLLRIFDLQIERIASPGFRGCPFQNTGIEFADGGHPASAVTVTYRRWLHDLFSSLVREAGLRNPGAVTGALIVLHDGSAASAQVDGNPDAARHARWAAAQLLDAHAP
jgi:AcrR family transcriptional regulator